MLPTRPSLLARLRNHDESAAWQKGWEEFYALYHPVIFGHAIKKGLGETDAEDVVQEIVVGVAGKLPTFQYDPAICSFKTWLFRNAGHKIADHFRKQGREARGINPEANMKENCDAITEIADENAMAPDREWDLMFERRLREAAIEDVTNRVKPMTMRLYLYHVIYGNSVENTVTAFRASQITPESVYVAKHRVQKMVDETVDRLRNRKDLKNLLK